MHKTTYIHTKTQTNRQTDKLSKLCYLGSLAHRQIRTCAYENTLLIQFLHNTLLLQGMALQYCVGMCANVCVCERVCLRACVLACVRAIVHACVRACVRVSKTYAYRILSNRHTILKLKSLYWSSQNVLLSHCKYKLVKTEIRIIKTVITKYYHHPARSTFM